MRAAVGGQPGQRHGQRVQHGQQPEARRDRGRRRRRARWRSAPDGDVWVTNRASSNITVHRSRRRSACDARSRCRTGRSRTASCSRRTAARRSSRSKAAGRVLKLDPASGAEIGGAFVGTDSAAPLDERGWRPALCLAIHHAAPAGRGHDDRRHERRRRSTAARCWCSTRRRWVRPVSSCCGTATTWTSRTRAAASRTTSAPW